MSGFIIRLRLWLKLWFTSLTAIILLLLFLAAAYVITLILPDRIDLLSSIFYERAALLLYVFILQWCFSIDFDSKFYRQLITYPFARWKLIIERVLLASLLLIGILSLITILLASIAGSSLWKGLLFTIPVYIGITGIVVVATVIGKHSLGGLFAGLVFWMVSLQDSVLMYLSPALLNLPVVYNELSGTSGLISNQEDWIYYNRLFYFGLGMLLVVAAILHFNRKSDWK
ncbi:hypothetical protein PAECIP111893_03803 [Paenibacillus plantiphilus]|uniref:ABC-2 type transport system permease protein n=1 Tax=Paenibacillus plantiphilus TaxID=2905650 RepID=A0ABM9CIQ9_9BACL|nr:hypothetical protein [Paenibacillus plantiphilus]CAH1214471.1 hypothetical protein PAECIP111893_03803 [Paenibacillus plantiphilus]